MNFKGNKGVTLLALTITIIVMLIITSTIIYNTNSHIKNEKINNFYNDIENLNAKIEDYYLKYGEVPTLGDPYCNKDELKAILNNNASNNNSTLIKNGDDIVNPNDSDDYYIVDLEKLEGLTLNYGYGEDYVKLKESLSKLPKGYQELEYIESTGTQWIDTEYIPNKDTRIIIDFNYTDVTSTFLCGARTGVNSNAYTINVSAGNAVTSYGATGNIKYGTPDTERHVIDKNKNDFYLDGVKKLTQTVSNFACTKTLAIFACNDVTNGDGYLKSKTRLYSFKIYDNDTLIRDFIPCYKTTGEMAVGLYDLVNNKFYENKGTGSFETEKNDEIEHNETDILGTDYQQLEYIESTGTQYIDTGYIPKTNSIINVDFKSTKQSGEAFTSLFGTQPVSASNKRLYILFGSDNNIQVNIPRNSVSALYLNNDGTFNTNTTGNYWNSERTMYTLDVKNKKINVDNITWNLSSYYTESVLDCENSLYLLTRNTGGVSDSNCTKGYLYGATIYEDNTLIQKLIPCYRKSDNEIGLYDIVNNNFYEKSGTGNFNAGNKVINLDENIRDDVYIINKETHQIYYPAGIFANDLMYYYYNLDNKDVFEIKNTTTENNNTITIQNDIFSTGIFKVYGNSEQLPATYQQVKYIGSTGSQYINTGILSSEVYGYEIEFQSTDIQQTSEDYSIDGIMGVNNTGSDTKIWFSYNKDNNTARNSILIQGINIYSETKTLDEYYNNKHKISVLDGNVYYDDISIGQITSSTEITKPLKIYVFAVNDTNNTPKFYSKTKLYSLKLYGKNNEVIADYIPCYNISSTVIGLYDLVNKKFLENAGSGEFSKGENVTTPITKSVGNLAVPQDGGKYKIPIRLTGTNNLFDPELVIKEYNTNSFTVGAYTTMQIPLKPNTTYYAKVFNPIKSSGYFYMSKNGGVNTEVPNTISLIDDSAYAYPRKTEKTITTNSTGYIYLGYYAIGGMENRDNILRNSKIQISEGTYTSTTVPDYEPYTEKTTNIYLKEPLRKLNDVADYIDLVNKKVVRYVKEENGVLSLLDVPTEEQIDFPEIQFLEGTNIVTVNTTLKPSKIDFSYYKVNE